MEQAEDTRKWCWRVDENDETFRGPFDTQLEALIDAREEIDIEEYGSPTILVGRCDYPDPKDYVHAIVHDLEDALEELDTRAYDNAGGNPDGGTFSAKPGAEEALFKALEDWAKEYIKAEWYNCTVEALVTLKGDKSIVP